MRKLSIYLLDEFTLGSEAGEAASDACDWTACNGLTLKIKVFEKEETYGQCQFVAGKDGSEDDFFCFVNADSSCADKVIFFVCPTGKCTLFIFYFLCTGVLFFHQTKKILLKTGRAKRSQFYHQSF